VVSNPKDDRRLTWEEWQSKRQALQEQTRRVGPAVTRRKESSSDPRLRAAFNGERIPDHSITSDPSWPQVP